MSAYVIYHYKITDRRQIDELTLQSIPVNAKYAAKVIVASPVKAQEGKTLPNMVILKFEDFKAAQKYYFSDEHQALSVLRDKCTEGWASILPGDSETQALIDSGYFECKA